MHLYDETTCNKFNRRFGCFHDGFIKKLEIVSDNKFLQEMPWEKKKKYSTNEEKLLATGLTYSEGQLLKIIICTYLYDWPNQPYNREVHIQIPHAEKIYFKISKLVGIDIFSLAAEYEAGKVHFRFAYHDPNSGFRICSMDNANKVALCTSKRARVMEK